MTLDVNTHGCWMHRLGHLGMGLLFAAVPTSVLLAMGFPFAGLPFAAATIGTSRLPDQAEAIPGIGHRTVTHTVVFALVVALISALGVMSLYVVGSDVLPVSQLAYVSIPVGAMLGVVSHLAADALTVGRGKFAIKPFWPVSERRLRVGVVKSGDTFANVGLLVTGGLMFAACLYLGTQTPNLG